ncbi:asparagine synthase (glutamine-hydrolysing) [Entomortierella parvispora]|uniref:Asparagine synthase (Glutamine-hydrolysing) n=1 Tax=Entomortierella parvispora TaxID=205924 RepID=A0A9P3LRX0_9FUNG|nr:asparagine synthase (glutamine-hydrolysing) [Entomortierella parvispora]
MCGITGWLSYDQNLEHQREVLQKMTETMALRGPDAHGLWIDGPAAVGHCRLSVIDLEGGRQPMVEKLDSQKDVAVITYSGEVYNFKELREELKAEGYHFNTSSDTEVVLKAYVAWGEDFVYKLNGMFAFAIWDVRTQEMILIRDRLGIKPLYYYRTHDGVIFGSEPKAILANPLVPRRVTAQGLRGILQMVRVPGYAVFAGMREVMPGEIVRINRQGIVNRHYWRLEARKHEDNLEDTIKNTRALLDDILARQIIADVPLCSLLSGGLDSSIITSLASKKLLESGKGNINSFSVDFIDHGAEFVSDDIRGTRDAPFVKDLAEHVHTNHRDVVLDSRELAGPVLRTKVIHAMDMAIVNGDMYPSLYCLFEEVKRHSTVALSGEGADEIFGGYKWFHDEDAVSGKGYPWMNLSSRKFFEGKSLLKRDLLEKLDLENFIKKDYERALSEVPILPGESVENHRMRQIVYLHVTRFLCILLDRKDRMSMAVGLEVRVPFLDHRLVEYVYNIPWDMKTFDGREKSILRAAGRDLLPNSIVERVKCPYPSTQDPAYEIELRAALAKIMEDEKAPVRPLLDDKAVKETLAREVGVSSLPYDRIAMDLVVYLNSWLVDYNVTLDLDEREN